jgi:uncharacterized protein (DUF1778 family)
MEQKKREREAPLTVRITATEKSALTQAAQAHGLTRNAFVREILNQHIPKEARHTA